MIWTIAAALFVAWFALFVVMHAFGGLVHLLLILAVVAIIYRLLSGTRSAI